MLDILGRREQGDRPGLGEFAELAECAGGDGIFELVPIARDELVVASRSWLYQRRNSDDGATSLIQRSIRGSSLRTPRGQSRSASTRTPSPGSGLS